MLLKNKLDFKLVGNMQANVKEASKVSRKKNLPERVINNFREVEVPCSLESTITEKELRG